MLVNLIALAAMFTTAALIRNRKGIELALLRAHHDRCLRLLALLEEGQTECDPSLRDAHQARIAVLRCNTAQAERDYIGAINR